MTGYFITLGVVILLMLSIFALAMWADGDFDSNDADQDDPEDGWF